MTCRHLFISLIFFGNTLFIFSQTRDSTKYSHYRLTGHILSRIGGIGDIGIERVKHIKGFYSCSSQITVIANKQFMLLAPVDKWRPKSFGIMLQPFHLLIGKRLQLETGTSVSFAFFRYKNNTMYPLDTSNWAYNSFFDRMFIMYTAGLRYSFKKPDIAFMILVGPKSIINLQHKQATYFNFNPGAGEFGISWRVSRE